MSDPTSNPITQELSIIRQRRERMVRLLSDPVGTMEVIDAHVSNGGSLIDLCALWDVKFSDIIRWIRADDSRQQQYLDAMNDRVEWTREKVLSEYRAIAHSDIRLLLDEGGGLLPPNQWPDNIAKAVSSLDIDELWEGKGEDRKQTGFTKKLKLWSKEKSLEQLGKTMAMFVEKHEVTGKMSLADLILSSMEDEESDGESESESGEAE